MSLWMMIAVGLVLVVGVLLLIAASKPDEFRIERQATIAAAPERIFAEVNDLAAWRAWSPWEKKDPGMKRMFSDSAVGLNARYEWQGNKEVGSGRMTISESTPSSRVVIQLEFLAPFQITHQATFNFVPEGGATRVSWAMTGRHPFIGKVMCLFMNPDKMIGGDFEAGLAALKQIAESRS